MDRLVLVLSLRFCFILVSVPASESACMNLQGRLSCLDFNCSINWNALTDADPGSHITYSLFFARAFMAQQQWDEVEGCVNVTTLQCSVRALFKDNDDFRGLKKLRMEYIINGTERCQGKKFLRDPLKSVVLSAPPVTHIEVGAEEVSFRLIYPTDHQNPDLDLQLLRQFINHKYQVNIREYDTDVTVWSYQIKNDLAGIQRIYDLLPATRYVIRVRSAVYPPVVWSPDTTIQVIRTREKPPSVGPRDLKLVDSHFSCTNPDVRNATVKWKSVDQSYWNGDLLFYEVQAILWETRVIETNVIVNISSTTVSLKGLSRWKDYEVVVFANNSAGGTRNNIPLQLKRHLVDERGSQPRSVSVSPGKGDKTTIHWEPPIHYSECIMGYAITWTDERGEEHHVIEDEKSSMDVKGHVTRVEVTPLLRKDYESIQRGITSSIYSNKDVTGFKLWFLLLGGAVALLIMTVVILIAKWRYIKLRWLKPRCKSLNLEHNKVLKPAFDRQVSYEPCLRHEKEIFDAPSPGVHSPGSLPPWSPDYVSGSSLETDLPLMTALLQQGLTVVDDIDEIDLAQATRDSVLEAKSRYAAKDRTSESSSKVDSAFDTVSESEVDGVDIATSTVLSCGDGYIAHQNLHEHLRANDPIGDYTMTGLSGYVPLNFSGDLPSRSSVSPSVKHAIDCIDNSTMADVSENDTNHSGVDSSVVYSSINIATPDNDGKEYVQQSRVASEDQAELHRQPSCVPEAPILDSPYVTLSEVMQLGISASRNGDSDIAEYSKQSSTTNLSIRDPKCTVMNPPRVVGHQKLDDKKDALSRTGTHSSDCAPITQDLDKLKC